MKSQSLLLIGGGHSHAIVLRQWAMHYLSKVGIKLLSDVAKTPYSGMLPGHVAGFYTYEETHINLPELAQFSHAEFIRDRAIGLNLEQKQVLCQQRPPIPFDYLSIDIGSTPSMGKVTGAKDYAIPAKPVPIFLQHWSQFLATVESNPEQPRNITIVGGGAGGVELALNMQQRLQPITNSVSLHLLQRGKELLPQQGKWVRRKLQQLLAQRGIQLYLGEEVTEVFPDKIICASGVTLETDRVFLVTQATAPKWIEESGLATDEKGFILVIQKTFLVRFLSFLAFYHEPSLFNSCISSCLN